jgi:hypothetical protein
MDLLFNCSTSFYNQPFMEQLTEELKTLLFSRGADLVGIGDMRGVENCAYNTGVSVAIALPRDIILDLQAAPAEHAISVSVIVRQKHYTTFYGQLTRQGRK